MSISPLISALTWVSESGIQTHSTRSSLTTLPPARPDIGSGRGLYFVFFRKTSFSPGFHSSLLEDERTGADHLVDLLEGIGLGDPLGHHEGHDDRRLAERLEQRPELLLEHDLEGLGVDDLVLGDRNDASFWPIESRADQRLSEATQSSAVTGGRRAIRGRRAG